MIFSFCYIVLAGENAFSFHREFLLSLKLVTLLKKDLRLMIFSENGSRFEGSEYKVFKRYVSLTL